MGKVTVHITVHPPGFDRNDMEGTVKKLCDYNIKLQEELQFLLDQLAKQKKEEA